MMEVDKVGGGRHILLMSTASLHCHPLQTEGLVTLGGERTPTPLFIFLPRCPNISGSLEKKDPLPCPRRQAASPSAEE